MLTKIDRAQLLELIEQYRDAAERAALDTGSASDTTEMRASSGISIAARIRALLDKEPK